MSAVGLPPGVKKYAESPVFSKDTIPEKLTEDHSTKPGVWGRICVHQGALKYAISGAGGDSEILTPSNPGIIKPEELHFVEAIEPVEFIVEFYR